ncbi:MAG: hypothetical protein QG611_1305, partial [Bacteroidota bacterium]|nr:hypothetical protein [Bacteroidota bacterium]
MNCIKTKLKYSLLNYLKKMILTATFFILIPLSRSNVSAQVSKEEVPMIGAELFIEPGQKP